MSPDRLGFELEWDSPSRMRVSDSTSWVWHSLDWDSLQDQIYIWVKLTLANESKWDSFSLECDLSDLLQSETLSRLSEILNDTPFLELESDSSLSMTYSAVRLSIKPEWVQTPLLEWESDSNESATHLLEWGSLCRTLMLLVFDSEWDNISWVRHSLDCDSLQDQNYSGEKFTLSNETLSNPTDILNVEWDLSDMVYSRVGLPWMSETLQNDIRFWVRHYP